MSKRDEPELKEEKLAAIQQAVAELNNSGTVAVGDICNTTDSLELKKNSPLYWHNFIEVSGFVDAVAEKRLAAMQNILEEFIHNSQFSIQNSLVPHAPYSVSKKLFQLLNEKTAGQLISIHNQEAAAENDLYQNKTGDFLNLYKNFGIQIDSFEPTAETSLQSWLPNFTKGQKIISVHNTFTSEADLYFVQKQSMPLYFCVCINANLYIENKLPPIEMLMKNNGHIVLGTDSYASNEHLNMIEEIKTIRKHFPQIPLPIILQWATLNGAMALGIDEQYGSFDKGKNPGLVLIANDGHSSALMH